MRPVHRRAVQVVGWLIFAAVAGCAVGPDYHRPSAGVPPAWQPEAPWHEAVPSDAALKGNWWELFQDPVLGPLVDQALRGNQNLRVAAARLEQARSQVTVAKSYLYPNVDLQASAARAKTSANRPLSAYNVPNQQTVQNDFELGPTVSYELDLFGRVRRIFVELGRRFHDLETAYGIPARGQHRARTSTWRCHELRQGRRFGRASLARPVGEY